VKPPELLLIGLTGNIACGKSTVVAMLEQLGAWAIDADAVTRRVQQPGTPVYRQIVETFGEDILTAPGGPLDRKKLGALVFQDPALLEQLERIIHPTVHAEIMAWLAQVAQEVEVCQHHTDPEPFPRSCSRPPVAVIDAIKLIEAGWKPHCDAIWVVTCPEHLQQERLVHNRGMSESEARQRIAAQPPQESRLACADVVIDTAGTLEETRAQVEAAWQRLFIS
jgi:dephospho-CoA kinase